VTSAVTKAATGRSRFGGARWASAGLFDQALLGLANAGNTLVALAVFSPSRAGVLLMAATVTYFAIGINRALVCDVLLAMAPRYDGERRQQLVRDGWSATLIAGIGGGVIFAILAILIPSDLRDLIWLAPFLPIILLQDTSRYTYLSAQRPAQALRIDLIWVLTQAMLLIAGLVIFGRSPGVLLVAWGTGAAAGLLTFVIRERPDVRRGRPLQWLPQTRHLSGWFTATALIGQAQSLIVATITQAWLSSAALAGLRGAQIGILQPVQNFQQAVQGLLVPRLSRLAGKAGEGDEAAARGFRKQLTMVAGAFVGLAVVAVAVLWPVAQLVLVHIDKFRYIAPLAAPVSLQAGLYLIQVPFTAALRGMHQAKLLFLQYAGFTTTSLTGLVIGTKTAGLNGAAWGLTTGALVGLVIMVGLCLTALKRLSQPKSRQL
jgi:hypothetical protein